MAVEDHPLYEKWSDALAALKNANDYRQHLKKTNASVNEKAKASEDLEHAKAAFDAVSMEIGD